jgi:hypothetical protein
MDRIRNLDSFGRQCESGFERLMVLNLYVLKPQQFSECTPNRVMNWHDSHFRWSGTGSKPCSCKTLVEAFKNNRSALET